MSEEDCLRLFPYWTNILSFGQYLWFYILQTNISTLLIVSSVSSPQPKLVSSWLYCLNAFHAVTLPCLANGLTVSQPVTAWKAGTSNIECLGRCIMMLKMKQNHLHISSSANYYNTLPTCKPYRTRRLCVRVFAIPWAKNMQRTLRAPVGMLPQHCMRVILYGLPTGLRTPSKSYRPGQPVGLMCSRYYALVTWNLWVIPDQYDLGSRTGLWPLGIPCEIIHLRRAWSHAYWISKGSLCALSIGTRTCHLYFHKGHVYVDVIWTLKPRKEPIRDPQGLILKAEWGKYTCGSICKPYGYIRRMNVNGPKW